MEIKNVNDKSFKKYGRVLKNYDCKEIIEKMKETELPEGVVYEPSVGILEDLSIYKELQDREFGGLPIQIGFCNGHNKLLNAVEYHRSSEINIAATDLVLLIGCVQDIEDDFSYDTAKIEAFKVPNGTAIEVYATTLHYAPCNTEEEGFRCVVVLPKDTNLELEKEIKKEDEDALLFARNKWLIGHEESGLRKDGAFIGLKGKNVSIE